MHPCDWPGICHPSLIRGQEPTIISQAVHIYSHPSCNLCSRVHGGKKLNLGNKKEQQLQSHAFTPFGTLCLSQLSCACAAIYSVSTPNCSVDTCPDYVIFSISSFLDHVVIFPISTFPDYVVILSISTGPDHVVYWWRAAEERRIALQAALTENLKVPLAALSWIMLAVHAPLQPENHDELLPFSCNS